jgi:hypothetical protein
MRCVIFMVIERFATGHVPEVYRLVRERGRSLPPGLTYLNSWVSAGLDRCFQLMETDDPALFQEWIAGWGDLVEFEIVPVTESKTTADLMRRLADAETTERP